MFSSYKTCQRLNWMWITGLQCCTIFLPEDKNVSSVLILAQREKRRDKEKCNTYSETLVPCYTWTQLQLHISKLVILLTYLPTYQTYCMHLKMFKMLQIPLSCKRYTNHSGDAKWKMAQPHSTLDNTNVSICTSRSFRESSCTGVTEASVPVQSLQCKQTLSPHAGWCLSLAACSPACRHTSLFKQSSECRQAGFDAECWLEDEIEIKEKGVWISSGHSLSNF